jgi:hypothetical protein
MNHLNIATTQKQSSIASSSILFSKMYSSSNESEDNEQCICPCEEIDDSHKLRSNDMRDKIPDEYAFIRNSMGHSEILALAYNFLNNRRPSFIQITNNIRICPDCR